jgi:hypothetical protein
VCERVVLRFSRGDSQQPDTRPPADATAALLRVLETVENRVSV